MSVPERGPGLDEAAAALSCTVDGAFVAKVEGLAGSAMGGLGLGGLDDNGVMGGVLGGVMGVFPEDVGAKVTAGPYTYC